MRLPFWKHCIPFPLLFLFILLFYETQAQQTLKTYKGVVLDSLGLPVEGASVMLKNQNKGTSTQRDGSFTIHAAEGSVVVISNVGFTTRELLLQGNELLRIRLDRSANSLNDIIVVAYGTQKKATVTGAVSTISSIDLVRTPSVGATSSLVGKMQGITARAADARPGNGTTIQIRNLGTPLYVIDGVPYSVPDPTTAFGLNTGLSGQDVFNSLGLEDIESVTILKDASASIYGLRASNGVVLVTTKKGKRGEAANINVSGYYGLQNYTRYYHPANAGEYVLGLLQSEQNLGNDPSKLYTPEQLAKWQAGTEKGYKSYDYFKMVMRPNVPQSYISASASGGSQRANYYFSLSNINQQAIIRDYNYNRTNLQLNLNSSIAKGLQIGAQVSARLEKRHNVGVPGLDDYFNPFLSITSMWPTEAPYANDNPQYINQTHNVNVNPATYKNEITGYMDDIFRGINTNLNAQYDFKFGLTAKFVYSYNYTNEDFNGFEYTWNAYTYNEATKTYETQPGFGNQNPWRERHKRNIYQRFGQFSLNYNKQFGEHSLSVLAAYERSDNENTYLVVHTVPPNNYIPIQLLANQDYLEDDWATEARAGYVGRINYNYKQRYLVEGVGRYDGSYLYAPGHRYGFFPGVSLGWRISEEPFFKKAMGSAVNELKLRVSYGTSGSEIGDAAGNPPAAFSYIGGYNFNTGSSIFNNSYTIGIRPRGLPIENFSWVHNHIKNIGLDMGFLHNHLTATVDVFERRRTGLPALKYDVLLPSEVGYSLPLDNLNADATRGMEGIVTYNNKAGDIAYSVSVNATVARQRSLHTYKPRFGNGYDEYRNSIENRWSNVTWGYHVSGRFQSQQQIADYKINNDGQGNITELPGDFMYEDVNHDGIINYLDQKPIGYAQGAQPYLSGGINMTINYKGFGLAVDFAGATMQSFVRDYELRYPFQNNGNSADYMLTDVWHRADVYDPNSKWIAGTYPALRKGNTTHVNYALNDFWVTNVHYLRMKNLELSYTFSKKILKKLGATRVRVYANGTNLFSFDNVRKYGIDPEISSGNGLVYPSQRLYTFGFNLSL